MAEFKNRSAHLLLPHEGTARLVTAIVRAEPGCVEATAIVPANYPLVTGRAVPAFVGLEIGAQAAAALEALDRSATGGDATPRAGYLVGVRSAVFVQPELPVDTPLTAIARLEGAAPPLAVYRIEILNAGTVCVTATLSTYAGPPADGDGATSTREPLGTP